MNAGRAALKRWLKQTETTQAELVARMNAAVPNLEITETTLWRHIKGTVRGRAFEFTEYEAIAIQRVTGIDARLFAPKRFKSLTREIAKRQLEGECEAAPESGVPNGNGEDSAA